MRLGTYSPEISGESVMEVFCKAREFGFSDMQYDFMTSHGDTIPGEFFPDELDLIREAMEKTGIRITAVNGTYNLIDPDRERKERNTRNFENIAYATRELGAEIITLSTGSRCRTSTWRYHPDSILPEAWDEMKETAQRLLPVAEKYGLYLGIETEATNVVCTLERTRRFLDEMKSPLFKVIMDCANIFPAGTARRELVIPTIDRAFDLLGEDVILAHGKDILESDTIRFTGAGQGIVDFDCFFDHLAGIGYRGGLIAHGLHQPGDFEIAVNFLNRKAAQHGL